MNGSSLPKHQKYAAAYRPGETFWGFGVEHETYLESAIFENIRREDLTAYRRPERYSVNYYKSYKEKDLVAALSRLPAIVSEVPTLVNSHSFTHCDVWMNHMTTYGRIQRPNPRYSGRTVHAEFMEASPWFRDAYDRSVVYDGDTFEFMNVNFYNVSVEEALEELWETEDRFLWEFNRWIMGGKTIGNEACKGQIRVSENPLNELQHISAYGPFCIARRNHAWARHLTNPYHYSMFNNGTVHVNLTLPTKLDASGEIADADDFRLRHQRAARYFQWFEPLLTVVYGATDPFSGEKFQETQPYSESVGEGVSEFSASSQRLAVSRYVGMCNYPTEEMPEGKVLLYDVSGGMSYVSPGVRTCHVPFDTEPSWYANFYKRTAYVCLASHGLDINYKKHWNHGLEFRIFDGLRRDQMLEVCQFIWRICHRAQEFTGEGDGGVIADCRHVSWFQELVLGCMLEGADYVIPWAMLRLYLEAIHYRNVELGSEKEGDGMRVGVLCGLLLGAGSGAGAGACAGADAGARLSI